MGHETPEHTQSNKLHHHREHPCRVSLTPPPPPPPTCMTRSSEESLPHRAEATTLPNDGFMSQDEPETRQGLSSHPVFPHDPIPGIHSDACRSDPSPGDRSRIPPLSRTCWSCFFPQDPRRDTMDVESEPKQEEKITPFANEAPAPLADCRLLAQPQYLDEDNHEDEEEAAMPPPLNEDEEEVQEGIEEDQEEGEEEEHEAGPNIPNVPPMLGEAPPYDLPPQQFLEDAGGHEEEEEEAPPPPPLDEDEEGPEAEEEAEEEEEPVQDVVGGVDMPVTPSQVNETPEKTPDHRHAPRNKRLESVKKNMKKRKALVLLSPGTTPSATPVKRPSTVSTNSPASELTPVSPLRGSQSPSPSPCKWQRSANAILQHTLLQSSYTVNKNKKAEKTGIGITRISPPLSFSQPQRNMATMVLPSPEHGPVEAVTAKCLEPAPPTAPPSPYMSALKDATEVATAPVAPPESITWYAQFTQS